MLSSIPFWNQGWCQSWCHGWSTSIIFNPVETTLILRLEKSVSLINGLPPWHDKAVCSLQNVWKFVLSLGLSFWKSVCLSWFCVGFFNCDSSSVLVFSFPWDFSSKIFSLPYSTAHASASKTSSLPGYGKNGLHRVRRWWFWEVKGGFNYPWYFFPYQLYWIFTLINVSYKTTWSQTKPIFPSHKLLC